MEAWYFPGVKIVPGIARVFPSSILLIVCIERKGLEATV